MSCRLLAVLQCAVPPEDLHPERLWGDVDGVWRGLFLRTLSSSQDLPPGSGIRHWSAVTQTHHEIQRYCSPHGMSICLCLSLSSLHVLLSACLSFRIYFSIVCVPTSCSLSVYFFFWFLSDALFHPWAGVWNDLQNILFLQWNILNILLGIPFCFLFIHICLPCVLL